MMANGEDGGHAPWGSVQVSCSDSVVRSGAWLMEALNQANELGMRGYSLREVRASHMPPLSGGWSATLVGEPTGIDVRRRGVATFALEMERVLRDHDPQCGETWREEDIHELLFQLEGQVMDLRRGLKPRRGGADLDGAIKDCLDVANYAYFLHARLAESARMGDDDEDKAQD